MLLESVLSIALLSVMMAALTAFMITATDSTNGQRTRQVAVQVADTQLDLLAGIQSADLPLGRTKTLVDAQFAAAPLAVTPWLATMTRATDSRSSTLTIPMSESSVVTGTVYTLTTYLGWCSLPTQTSAGTDCTNTAAATDAGLVYLRAVVAVTWSATGCPSGKCLYADAVLLSTADDPVFTLNQSPPSAAIIDNPGDQSSAVNDTIRLQLTLQENTGVPPYTWQVANLPAGLAMDTDGLITGTPTTTQSKQTVTVTVTDAFLRTSTTSFGWTVLPDLVPVRPAAQTSYVGTTITSLTLSASGGSGSPYTWTDPGTTLPTGLSLSTAGVISGKPTAVGTYAVKLVVSDSSGRTRNLAFTWTVTYAPLTAAQSDRTSSLNTSVGSVTLTATGGSGTYVWTDPGATLPTGLTLSSAGVVTGTPTRVGTFAVRLTVTDAKAGMTTTASFTWTVTSAPTVSGLTNPLRTTVGATVTPQALSYTCPTSNCTFTLSGAPTGIGLSVGAPLTSALTVNSASGTIYLAGTITGPAGSYTVKVTPKDNVNSTVGTVNASAWTVVAKPSLSAITTLKTSVAATIADQALTYSCPSSACTFSVSSGPSGIGLDSNQSGSTSSSVSVSSTSGTIYLRGTIAASTATGSKVVTVVSSDDTADTPDTTVTSTWTLLATMRLGDPGPVTTSSRSTPSDTVNYTCQYSTCTIRVSGQPGGIGIGTSSRTVSNTTTSISVAAGSGNSYVSGKVDSGSAGTYQVVTTITDAANSVFTTSATWTVTS